tara:strand:- start:451 stop:588 length:138 start_codon:yes stop_codon:yes gene_type:complete
MVKSILRTLEACAVTSGWTRPERRRPCGRASCADCPIRQRDFRLD